MAIGDILNPKRVRTQANERLDTIDADALSFVAREFLDAHSRAVVAVPRSVGSSTPTGLIVQGFGLTLNPTGASDNKVRVQSAVGVAFDADGRLLIKENGVQVDLTLPSGNSQIYVYYVESTTDTTVRRNIPVSSPFTEGGVTMSTKLKGDAAFFVRAGDQTSIVASDFVNGATTALCFLGVANNSAGTITMTGYNATTAPNGAFATNRITSVTVPTTLPTTNTMNGSIGALQDLVAALAYMVGQAVWKGSVFPSTIANNFRAWTAHPTSSVATLSEYLAAGFFTGPSSFSGTTTMTGPLIVADLFQLFNEAAANNLGSSQNNFNPSGLSTANILHVNSTTPINITGLVPTGNGRILYIYNNGAQNITLTNQDAASTAANRIIGRGAANTVLTPSTAVTLIYSSFAGRWLVLSDTL
jgi:hypothetical protein